MDNRKSGKRRDEIRIGHAVAVVQKADQRTGTLTRGRVQEVLTSSLTHPHGIRVRLDNGRVARVAALVETKTGRAKNETDGQGSRRLP
jgi:uncharacterized repeat protein (TIGR03833 family)